MKALNKNQAQSGKVDSAFVFKIVESLEKKYYIEKGYSKEDD